MSHDDFEIEPVEGLPEKPPEGEQILETGKSMEQITIHLLDVNDWYSLMMTGAVGFTCPYTAAAALRAMHVLARRGLVRIDSATM